MKNTFVKIGGILPKILENTTLSLSLSGWPATIAIGFACAAGVVCYAIHEGAKQTNAGQAKAEQAEAEQAEARQLETEKPEARQPEAEQAETGQSDTELDCLVRISDSAA